jgi:hypothetical protein
MQDGIGSRILGLLGARSSRPPPLVSRRRPPRVKSAHELIEIWTNTRLQGIDTRFISGVQDAGGNFLGGVPGVNPQIVQRRFLDVPIEKRHVAHTGQTSRKIQLCCTRTASVALPLPRYEPVSIAKGW